LTRKPTKSSAPQVLVHHLNVMNFADFIRNNERVIVDFWSPTCGPCRMMEPIFERLAREVKGKVTFAKVDVSVNPLIAQQLGIMAVPTFALFKNGKLVNRFSGAVGDIILRSVIQKYLARMSR